MDKRYRPDQFEDEIYRQWERSGAFSPKENGEPYCIIMPPPNANDPLHVGHAMFVTVEDILVRFERMRGKAVLWLPGVDHAGIETQYVFEKELAKKGKSRFDFDRETLYQMIWDYVQKNSQIVMKQFRKLGASADWERNKFTLDEDIVEMVIDTFKQLYDDGLVYRDLQLVNYCTECGTAFSDLEVKHVERKTPLYYIKYGPFSLATVRPETKFGDTGVAVNLKDKRYKKWVGKEIVVRGLLSRFKMKVVADKHVDLEFGTGVVKVTPAHDPNDFEMGKKHGLEMKQVIGFDGRLNELTGKYVGLGVMEARKRVVKDLKKAGLLEKVDENYRHTIGVCYRCGSTIEPLPLPQFFIKVKPLTEKVLKVLETGKVKIYGSGHDKILKHWLENLRDWNVSRQIVWGIQIPVWYKKNSKLKKKNEKFNEELVVAKDSPGKEYVQETDTFDTWFSSAQWPYATLMANKKDDFKRFYPTQVMETGYDILPFWVMRMLMMGLYKTGKVPFEKVYLHGLVRDEKGQKMSKSKGNVIDPLEVIKKYGADALRMSLVMSTTAGRDSATGEGKIRGMRNLTNKIWNASRFVIEFLDDTKKSGDKDEEFIKDLSVCVKTMTKRLEKLKVGQAAEWIYHWFWHTYCDQYIEIAKKGHVSKKLMLKGLRVCLRLLHPFVPFVTEAVWQQLPETEEKMLISAKWPEV